MADALMKRSPLVVVKNTLSDTYVGLQPAYSFPLVIHAVAPGRDHHYTLSVRPSLQFRNGGEMLYEFSMEAALKVSEMITEESFFEIATEFAGLIIKEFNAELGKMRSSLLVCDLQHPVIPPAELHSNIKSGYSGPGLN